MIFYNKVSECNIQRYENIKYLGTWQQGNSEVICTVVLMRWLITETNDLAWCICHHWKHLNEAYK